MMAVRSEEIMKLRRRLARLLWRLRAIRNHHPQQADLSERLQQALTEAGSIRGFLIITMAQQAERTAAPHRPGSGRRA
jgi:hypothetical protein